MKRVFLVLGALLLLLVAILVARTLSVTSMQLAAAAAAPLAIDRASALARFARAIQFRTVSYSENPQLGEHDEFIAWIASSYPRVHASLRAEVVNRKSLLYTW